VPAIAQTHRTVRCEVVPSGTAADLLGVCMLADGTALAVGRAGTVLRWDGATWTREDAGTDEDLYAVGATDAGAIAVGGNLNVGDTSLICERRDGRWTAVRSPVQSLLLAVHASGSSVHACGFNAALVERDGAAWRELAPPTNAHLFGIGSIDGRVLACGLGGTLVDVESLEVDTIAGSHLTSIAVTGHIVGFDGTVLVRDRASWRELPRVTRQHLWSVTPFGAGALAVGAGGVIVTIASDHCTLIASDLAADLHSVCGPFAVGRRGTIVRITD
jgi:hypothetical protein